MVFYIVALAFLIFIVFIYLPLNKRLSMLKNELHSIEMQVSQIKKAVGEGRPLEEAITFFKNRLEILDRKFPDKDETILRELSTLAVKTGVEVVSMRPQKKKIIQDINGLPIKINVCYVQEMPITMNLKAPYKTIGEFVKLLREDFPVFVRIDMVHMQRAEAPAGGALDVTLDLDTYLICARLE